MQMPPIVTERAFERLAEIGASGQGMGLRVAVEGGGCSGFQYDIKLDQAAADDLVLEGKGESVIVVLVSLPFLQNATIDFEENSIRFSAPTFSIDRTKWNVKYHDSDDATIAETLKENLIDHSIELTINVVATNA